MNTKPIVVNQDASLLRRLNTRAVLRVLRDTSAETLTRLAGATGLSRQTVEAVLAELADAGLVYELAPAEGATGRPARRFGFRADAGYVVGLDIGARRILAMVADLNGTVVSEDQVEVDEHLAAPERLATAERIGRAVVETAGVTRTRIWAAAAGTSGVVDRTGRVTLSTLIPGWTGLDLARRVGGWFRCPGFAANDANLAAVAEHWRGSARHVEDVAYVLSGYRSGHGVLLDGRLHAGRTGAAGELGRLLDEREDPSVVLDRSGRTADEVFAAARTGNAKALRVVDRLAYGLAKSAAALVMVVDPDLVVVGGGFSRAADLLLDPMRERLSTMCLHPPEVVASTFGEEAIGIGAVRIALDHVEVERLAG